MPKQTLHSKSYYYWERSGRGYKLKANNSKTLAELLHKDPKDLKFEDLIICKYFFGLSYKYQINAKYPIKFYSSSYKTRTGAKKALQRLKEAIKTTNTKPKSIYHWKVIDGKWNLMASNGQSLGFLLDSLEHLKVMNREECWFIESIQDGEYRPIYLYGLHEVFKGKQYSRRPNAIRAIKTIKEAIKDAIVI